MVGRSRNKWKNNSRNRPEGLCLEVVVVDDDETVSRNTLYLSFHTVLASQS
jgi:hypothetical protein